MAGLGIQVYLDENVNLHLAAALNLKGYDATHALIEKGTKKFRTSSTCVLQRHMDELLSLTISLISLLSMQPLAKEANTMKGSFWFQSGPFQSC